MSQNHFHNQVVLVTGASSGIGRALARALAQQGAHLVLIARQEAKLRAVEQELGALPGQRLIVSADVRKQEDVKRAVTAALDRFQRIDVLVNNAGIGYCGTVANTPLEEFRDLMDTNFFGALLFLQAVMPHMIRQRSGIIIQVSSVNGFCAVPFGSAYCASKFALEALSQSARLELRKHNVHVLVARPGITDTEFFDHAKHFREQNPFPLRNLMAPDTAAAKILHAAATRRCELVLTTDGTLMWWLKKFAPRLLDRLILLHVKERPHP